MNKENLQRLRNIKGFMFDLDGTMMMGDKRNNSLKALPGAIELVKYLNKTDIPYVTFTNGTVRPDTAYLPLLRDLGFPLRDNITMTPSTVAAEYFQQKNYRRILVLGCEGVWQPLREAGLEVVLPGDINQTHIDGVYVGWYREFVLSDLDPAYAALMNGAKLFSASMVPFFASAGGKAIGSSFVIAGMLEKLTGARTKVLGKPSVDAMKAVSRRLGVPAPDIAIVGDDPLLEITMAHKAGALAVAVQTGLCSAGDFDAMDENLRPHLNLSGVLALYELYRK
ncbi:MAG: HAD hydrolase-like protein [Pseudomonadales bacterium]|nr:HAD hydrolase-like protein [Pseudomonadales bacterium]